MTPDMLFAGKHGDLFFHMKLDITFHRGRPDKPVVIFIHGLGVDKNFWVDPPGTKVLGGSVPLNVFAAGPPRSCLPAEKRKKISIGFIPDTIDNLWTAVTDKGFNALCWSQKRPVGPIHVAVEELEEIHALVKKEFPGNLIAVIGHSRGGLIARKFMERKVPEIKALITISTPHAGSSLSRLGKYLSPLAPFLEKILPEETHGTVSNTIKRLHELLEGNALKELLPGSDFIRTLRDTPSEGIIYVSFGGTKTKMLTVYTWKKQDNRICPKPLLTVPDSLLKALPQSVIPGEITPGMGDFLVTAASSVMPLAQKHYNVPANHMSITWHKKTINKTIEVLEKI